MTTLAGLPGQGGSQDGSGGAARFINPIGVTTDGAHVYVTSGAAIRRIVIATGEVTTLAGNAFTAGANDGAGINARFSTPMGITTDGTYLYVADFGNNTIRRVAIATGEVTTLAGQAGSSGNVDGVGSSARFIGPRWLTTDGEYLYVTTNVGLRRVAIRTATVSTPTFGNSAVGGITTDGAYLYTTNPDQRVHKISLATGVDTAIAGNPDMIPGEVDGDADTARFALPQGIATDGARLFVTDYVGLTVRAIE